MDNTEIETTMEMSEAPTREAAPRKRGRKPSATKTEKQAREPRAAYEPQGLILAALDAINAVRDDNDLLFDKKGIAQIVKIAVELRDLGKTARQRAGIGEEG
jgi:hypothetical protein